MNLKNDIKLFMKTLLLVSGIDKNGVDVLKFTIIIFGGMFLYLIGYYIGLWIAEFIKVVL